MLNKILIILILLISAAGCNFEPIDGTIHPSGTEYRIRVIEDCQYIEVREGYSDSKTYSLTHKGNCNNPIHYRNLEKHE